jgi:hypothetical protein
MSTNDPEFYQAPKFSPEPPPAVPRQHGCFFYGCIIASVLALLMVILVAIGSYFLYRFASQVINDYTSTEPRVLPKVEMPAEQRQVLKDRFEGFRKAVNEGTPTEPLVLTSDDLNALIEENPELKGLIYVKVEGDEVKGQISIPLDKLGIGMVRGRYLNGEADLKASLQGGALIVTLDALEVNGKPVPEQFMKGIREKNLANDLYKEKKNAEMIQKFESLEIKDGKIIIKVRAKPGEQTGTKAVDIDVSAPPAAEKSKAMPRKDEPPKVKVESSPADAPAPTP